MSTKHCTKCNKILSCVEFSKSGFDKNGEQKYRPDCKTCTKDYYENKKEEISDKRKKRREKKSKEVREYFRNYHNKNKNKIHVLQKNYRDNNLDKERIRKLKYYENNPEMKFAKMCRNRIASIFKTGQGYEQLLDCDATFLQEWIEFGIDYHNDMTKENYGSYWHLDHVIPISLWDLTNKEQKNKCFHWTNLMPLQASQNIQKGNSISLEQIEEQNRRIEIFMGFYDKPYSLLNINDVARPTIAGSSE